MVKCIQCSRQHEKMGHIIPQAAIQRLLSSQLCKCNVRFAVADNGLIIAGRSS